MLKKKKMRIGRLIEMLWSKIFLFFGGKYDESKIPEGFYCYTPDDEKNCDRESYGEYYIKPCVYYKRINSRWVGCKYLGYIGDDITFTDQCKLCTINYGIEEE